jgi:hypothetical protein
MSTRKLVRLATQSIERLNVKVLDATNHQGHVRLQLQLPDGAQHRITISSSPKNFDHAVLAITREVRKLITPAG